MRITPLDIRKQEFRKTMRGLDTDEVYAFLNTVAEEYEAVLSDNKRLRERVVEIEDRLKEFKSMETNLRNTLLTAERITAEAKENARKEAGLIVREAEVEAEKAAESIRAHTQQLRREILELRKNKDNYITRLRTLIESHQNVINGFEGDFAEVDLEIEKIGQQIDQDTEAAIKGVRMNRDKITEDFAHDEQDKVTWDDEQKREDIPRPAMPAPGETVEKRQNESSADQSTLGFGQGPEEAIAGADSEASSVEFCTIDAEHVDIVEEDDPGPDGHFNENEVRHEVAQKIENTMYPEAHIQEQGQQPPQEIHQVKVGVNQQGPVGEDMVNSQPAGQIPDNNPQQQAQDVQYEAQAGVTTVVQPEEKAPQHDTQPQPQSDDWKGYEVQNEKPDWSNYEIASGGNQQAPAQPRPAVEPSDPEVEAALSGLSENPEAEKPPQPAKQDPPSQAENQQAWSMEELRKNLTNIDRENE